MIALHIPAGASLQRLDKHLPLLLPEYSRARIQDWIQLGCVQVNERVITEGKTKVAGGAWIRVTIPPLRDAVPTPQDLPLQVVFEDSDLLVINKQAGLVVHPAPGHPDHTLVNALLHHCGEKLSGIGGVKRPGIIHRLDKDTSGLLLVTKTDHAHHDLARQLATRNLSRIYQAFVWGKLTPPKGTIDLSIGRHPQNRKKFSVVSTAKGKEARTHYKVVIQYGTLASQVECRLETGRTHQIRVHLAHVGHGLIGDSLYGRPLRAGQIPKMLRESYDFLRHFPRQALHASMLSFLHPTHGEKMTFQAELPSDLAQLKEQLTAESLNNFDSF